MVSSITMPFPLSACFMIMSGLFWRSLRAFFSGAVRLLYLFLGSSLLRSSFFVSSRYFSSVGFECGGSQLEADLKGCLGLSG